MNEPEGEPGILSPERMPATVGVITLVAGASLLAAPKPVTRLLGIEGQESAVRLVGLADLVLVPGLLGGRPRWPWMVGRAALNVGQAAYFQGVSAQSSKPGRTRASAVFLGALTLIDGGTSLLLKRRGS